MTSYSFCKIELTYCTSSTLFTRDLALQRSKHSKLINWERVFSNTSVNEKVDIFSRTILNILSNYIPHDLILCDEKDPPWFNNRIKTLKNGIYKIYRHNKDNPDLLYRLQFLQEQLSTSIESSKERYYAIG